MAKIEKEIQLENAAGAEIVEFMKLSKLLFGDKAPYDINEIKPDNPFYKPAKELAEELEIDWEKMTHEESNRVMLSLLDDYYNKINVDKDYKYTLVINVEKKK